MAVRLVAARAEGRASEEGEVRLIERTCARIEAPDEAIALEVQRRLDKKTKPRGSLGRLEEVACQIASVRGTATPELPRKAIVVMAGDHGVAAERVSAFPQEVTAQMVQNFARGGAAINVLSRQVGAKVVVVDMGVKEPLAPHPEVRSIRIGPGTQNFARDPAMTREQAVRAVEAGIRIADELADDGIALLGIGEMGIGNTTAASAIASVFTGGAPGEVTGRGSGVDDQAHRRKVAVIRRALELHRPDANDPLDVLAKVGGFEIAGLAGVALGSAQRRVPVVVDGFIASAAALVAARFSPRAAGAFIAAHRSVEVGHRLILQALGTRPLLDLEMRLGEGTGAALAMGLVDAALRILHDMATFASAGVSDSGV